MVYLPHGGGPWPFVNVGFGDPRGDAALLGYLRGLPDVLTHPPEAILCVSAHWEEPVPTVMTHPHPPLLFDYLGFPPASYQLTWPAPNHPGVVSRVRALLTAAGIPSAENSTRGYDHGTFVPLKVAWPLANIPVVQLSLQRGLDPAAHLAIGHALAPLRDEGVLIVGSGMSYQNMQGFVGSGRAVSEDFDAWLHQLTTLDPATRRQRLLSWSTAPSARRAHPREEHLVPLMVIVGAAERDPGVVAFNDVYAGVRISALHFG